MYGPPDRPPRPRTRRLALQCPDHADRDRRRTVRRVSEVADQIHGLGLVGLVRRKMERAGGGRDAPVAADDLEVGGLGRGATDEPVEGDRDVVEPLLPVGQPTAPSVPQEALRIFGTGRGSEPVAPTAAGSRKMETRTANAATTSAGWRIGGVSGAANRTSLLPDYPPFDSGSGLAGVVATRYSASWWISAFE